MTFGSSPLHHTSIPERNKQWTNTLPPPSARPCSNLCPLWAAATPPSPPRRQAWPHLRGLRIARQARLHGLPLLRDGHGVDIRQEGAVIRKGHERRRRRGRALPRPPAVEVGG